MEVSKEKSKKIVNNENDKSSIVMDGTLLEDVYTFKYLGATLKSDGYQIMNYAFGYRISN